jgi:hypothetical protein
MCGINYYNKDVLQLSTFRGYATAVNTLFQLRGFKQPTNLSNPSNMAGIIINNLIKEETVASQHSLLDSTIFAELQQAASSSHSCNSDQNILFDILTLACFIGPCVSEYAQTLAGNVGNMLATCPPDSQMLALWAKISLSRRHKTNPNTVFLCQGLPTFTPFFLEYQRYIRRIPL